MDFILIIPYKRNLANAEFPVNINKVFSKVKGGFFMNDFFYFG